MFPVLAALLHVSRMERVLTQTQATGYQRRTVKRKVMILLALLVFGMIIVLVVKPKRHSSPPPAPEEESPNNIRSLLASVDRGRRHRLSSRFARDRWMDPDIFR